MKFTLILPVTLLFAFYFASSGHCTTQIREEREESRFNVELNTYDGDLVI